MFCDTVLILKNTVLVFVTDSCLSPLLQHKKSNLSKSHTTYGGVLSLFCDSLGKKNKSQFIEL